MSGRATIVGFTVNAHQWHPAFPPPYVIAVVALDEDPTVRLTTHIVGVEPDEVQIGQEVAVRFEHHDDVWLPRLRAHRRPRPMPTWWASRPGFADPARRWATSGSNTGRCCRASGARVWAAG